MEFYSKVIEELKKENEELKRSVARLAERDENFTSTVTELQQRLAAIETQPDEMQQYQHKYNLEIHGVPETEEEDLEDFTVKFAAKLGVNSDTNEINITHLLPRRALTRLVKFFAHSNKILLYQARRKLGKLNSKSEFQCAQEFTSTKI